MGLLCAFPNSSLVPSTFLIVCWPLLEAAIDHLMTPRETVLSQEAVEEMGDSGGLTSLLRKLLLGPGVPQDLLLSGIRCHRVRPCSSQAART